MNSPKIPAVAMRQTRGMGRGVFARRVIASGALIESCPVIPLTKREEKRIAGTALENYAFEWGEKGHLSCIALGLGSLYNHARIPNARFIPLPAAGQIEFVALRRIEEGEEIFINYGWEDAELDELEVSHSSVVVPKP